MMSEQERKAAFQAKYHDLCQQHGYQIMPQVTVPQSLPTTQLNGLAMVGLPLQAELIVVPIADWQGPQETDTG